MSIFKYLFITLTILLLTACGLENTSAPALITPSESVSTQESTQMPTEISPSKETQGTTPAANSIEPKQNQPNADVTHVRAVLQGSGAWTFYVTVEHPDTGWADYADGWDVVTPDGTILKLNPDDPFTRLLLHPHVNEQPFTRSQRDIVMPAGVTQVIVRAHDIVDGFGGQEILVNLEEVSGPGFEVKR
jgi:hypothetical protein